MIKKIRELLQKLSFRQIILTLLITVVLLVFLSLQLPISVRQQLGLPVGTTGVGLDFDIGDTNPEDNVPEPQDYTTNASYNLIEALPHADNNFSVTTEHLAEIYYVSINPATGFTREDVFRWFESFKDVDDASKLNIVFINPERGPAQ